jgi:hypothetical protein
VIRDLKERPVGAHALWGGSAPTRRGSCSGLSPTTWPTGRNFGSLADHGGTGALTTQRRATSQSQATSPARADAASSTS